MIRVRAIASRPKSIAQRARGGFDAKDDKATSQWNVLK